MKTMIELVLDLHRQVRSITGHHSGVNDIIEIKLHEKAFIELKMQFTPLLDGAQLGEKFVFDGIKFVCDGFAEQKEQDNDNA